MRKYRCGASPRGVAGSPRNCSGDMYASVPITAPVTDSSQFAPSPATVVARPKSVITARTASPSRARNTFALFRSRCTTPASCAA
jgi:hypothetical protein